MKTISCVLFPGEFKRTMTPDFEVSRYEERIRGEGDSKLIGEWWWQRRREAKRNKLRVASHESESGGYPGVIFRRYILN